VAGRGEALTSDVFSVLVEDARHYVIRAAEDPQRVPPYYQLEDAYGLVEHQRVVTALAVRKIVPNDAEGTCGRGRGRRVGLGFPYE